MNRKVSTVAIVIIFAVLAGSFFLNKLIDELIHTYLSTELIDQLSFFGEYLAFVPGLIVVIVIVIVLVVLSLKGRVKEKKPDEVKVDLKEKRQQLIGELKAAEKSFLRHKIDQKTFNTISKDKNKELIQLESEIDAERKQAMSVEDANKLDSVAKDKKKIINDLLDQKKKKVYELKIAEKSFLKRKIDENVYKKLCTDINKEIIDIDGKVNAIQTANEIEKIQVQLAEGAKEIAKQRQNSKERVETHSLEDDLFSQLRQQKNN